MPLTPPRLFRHRLVIKRRHSESVEKGSCIPFGVPDRNPNSLGQVKERVDKGLDEREGEGRLSWYE